MNKDKRKRRVVPIWWRYAGVAALLLLFISIGFGWFNSTQQNGLIDTPTVVDLDNDNVKDAQNPTPKATQDINDPITGEVATQPEENGGFSNTSKEVENVAKGSNTPQKSSSRASQIITVPNNTSEEIALVDSRPQDLNTRSQTTSFYESYANLKQAGISEYQALIYAETTSAKDTFEKEELNQSQTIEEAIAQAEALKNAPLESESIDRQKWSVAPVIAPVYSMGLGDGSVIHSQFNDNSKSNTASISYGVGGSYEVAKRLKVRAGVNRIDFSNTTNEVMAFATVGGTSQPTELALATVRLNADANVYLMSASPLLRGGSSSNIASMQEDLGQLVMDYGYVELPVALEYRVVDKKFGVNVVGGFSTFFLNNNQISTVFEGETVVIGESSNLNSTSYSANFGIGFDYGITKQLNVMIEPTLKYQFNTFSRTFGDVQPMFIGVYTGLNFKF